MTTETIEYAEVVTQQEDITVCNDCGREVDRDGAGYHGPGEVLHFCSECRDRLTDTSFNGTRVSNWKVYMEAEFGVELRKHFDFYYAVVKAGLAANAGMLVLALAASHFGVWWWGSVVTVTWTVLSLLLMTLLWCGSQILSRKAKSIIE